MKNPEGIVILPSLMGLQSLWHEGSISKHSAGGGHE